MVPKAKSVPSVTLTPTGNTAGSGKKRQKLATSGTHGKSAMPLRPIEAQSVVNIAGMKYLVVPHPDPGRFQSCPCTYNRCHLKKFQKIPNQMVA